MMNKNLMKPQRLVGPLEFCFLLESRGPLTWLHEMKSVSLSGSEPVNPIGPLVISTCASQSQQTKSP